LAIVVAGAVVASGCSAEPIQTIPSASSSAASQSSPSADTGGLCQPFPDRLFDGFLDAYGERDLPALQELVTGPIEDASAIPHAGTATFDGITEWAEAGWAADDVLLTGGYAAFSPTRRSFQLFLTRENASLETRGIDGLSFTLDALTRGCTIDRLELSGPIIARGDPCAFYDAVADHAEVGQIPQPCVDGSGRFAREGHVAVWTGTEMLVFGGTTGIDRRVDGLAFHSRSGTWSRIPPPPAARRFWPIAAVWADREAILIGARAHGETPLWRYDPATGRWTKGSPPPRLLEGATAVWTGEKLLVWGGEYDPRMESHPRDGLTYDPMANRWRRIPPAPIRGRTGHVAVWTGTDMLVWGGGDFRQSLGDGAAYDPEVRTWRVLAPAQIRPREQAVAVWTGREMVVTGGTYVSSRAAVAAYDPVLDQWRTVADPPVEGRHWHSAVWTGEEVIIWGGYDDRRPLGDGAAYDPEADEWRRLPSSPLDGRCRHTAVWSGKAMVVFGGYPGCGSPWHLAFGDGAIYQPTRDQWKRVIPRLDSA
jgi:Kelch motif